jgi:hypothetical protein
MTRPYAARRLLAHGPLTLREFIDITGWSKDIGKNVLRRLVAEGEFVFEGSRHLGSYRLAE